MNITNLEITQATIELSLAFAFIITAIILLINAHHKRKGMKQFITMFFLISIILTFEAFAYICRGNTDFINVFVNKLANFMVFFFNYFLTVVFIRYMYSIFNKNNLYPPKTYLRIIDITFIAAAIILVVNIFTGWMYYFDEMNYYKRNYMWYVYTSFSLLLPVVATVLCSKYKDKISKINYWSILVYVWLPTIFIILQTFIYGYSILTIGIATDLFFMFAIYLMELRKTKINDDEIINVRIKRIQSFVLFIFISSFIGAAVISCFISINKMVNESDEKNSIIVSSSVSDKINNEFNRLITVSEAMSQASIMKYCLENNITIQAFAEDELKEYLLSIRNGFDYQMVYAVSDSSKAVYTHDGLVRYIDETDYGQDIWYKNFFDGDKDIEVNIDTDSETNYALTAFVNVKVKNNIGDVIGVCGIGVEVAKVINILKYYEEEYKTTINLVDKDGLIHLSTNEAIIKKEYLDSSYFVEVTSDNFNVISKSKSYKLTKYLEDIDMYIVIDFNEANNYALLLLITPSIIIFFIAILILSIFFLINYIDNRRAYETIMDKKRAAITDEMTGLLNRSAYEQDVIELKNIDLSKYVIIQFDINCLKLVNDTIGHKAGDELIVGTAHCISNVFQKYGKCYRIGGDEFIAILDCSKEILEENMITFEHLTSSYNGCYIKEISVSSGIVYCSEHPNMSLEEAIILADSLMYDNKNNYYNASGNKRR
ncbi:MAG: GGDEF domain-containing protein [Anaeroplasma sp.]